MLRKTVLIIAALSVMVIGFAGCGKDDEPEEATTTQTQTETEAVTETETTTEAQGSEAEFIRRISGLWLNGCKSAKEAKESARAVGCTDVSMTEFVESDGVCYMTTYGDIMGQSDGAIVPELKSQPMSFSYISPDYKTVKGTVGGFHIEFDMGDPGDQVITYNCGGYYIFCAYNGFSTFDKMNRYLDEKYSIPDDDE